MLLCAWPAKILYISCDAIFAIARLGTSLRASDLDRDRPTRNDPSYRRSHNARYHKAEITRTAIILDLFGNFSQHYTYIICNVKNCSIYQIW